MTGKQQIKISYYSKTVSLYMCLLLISTHSHLPKQGYKPKKNEQFPKYEKIVAIYYGD